MNAWIRIGLVAASLFVPQGAVSANADVSSSLNQLRAARGLPALSYSPVLEAVARRHAMDMSRKGFFSHKGSDGSTVVARTRAQGYHYCLVSENIARGQRSVSEVMRGWMASQGHRRNMLRPRVEEFALAEAPGHIWVMVLADPGC